LRNIDDPTENGCAAFEGCGGVIDQDDDENDVRDTQLQGEIGHGAMNEVLNSACVLF
jgi:hypothetical protein